MLLAFDVGYKATGWCWTSGEVVKPDLGSTSQFAPMLVAYGGVIVPTDGLSPKALREKRACEREAIQDRNLFRGIERVVDDVFKLASPYNDPFRVVAEVPALGSISAASARQMAASLACFECGCSSRFEVERYLRSDVVAAMFGKRRPKGDIKDVTRKVVQQRIALDLKDVPENLREHAYDAAACLFAARDAPSVRSQRWSEEAMNCLRMAREAGLSRSEMVGK
ncbi:MAG TPA: hypothetical protein VLZ09_02025 [Gaiellaceae bacterium]|nr:hypothetical protein [Gaiellaceae bacterium]